MAFGLANLLIVTSYARLLEKVIGHMFSNEVERPTQVAWRKSSFCASGECVEVAQHDDVIILRDSTRPFGTMLRCADDQWRSFLCEIKGDLHSLPGGPKG
jgi:hypothetical protein